MGFSTYVDYLTKGKCLQIMYMRTVNWYEKVYTSNIYSGEAGK